MNKSEEFVYELCKTSFLPFWSYVNVFKEKGDEMCDVLIMCHDIVIIISVKEVRGRENKTPEVAYNSWVKKAIDKSVKQIYGAERFFLNHTSFLKSDQKTRVNFTKEKNIKIFRIGVAFGRDPNFPLPSGDFGKGIVHVFDEYSIAQIFNELDTITDFVEYLEQKELFLNKENSFITLSNELDLLAFHFQNGINVEPQANTLFLDEGMWDAYVGSENYSKWRQDNIDSYFWDDMIKSRFQYFRDNPNTSKKEKDIEVCTRFINLENRLHRQVLAETLQEAIQKDIRSRLFYNKDKDSEHAYVYLKGDERNWETREPELVQRCMVARIILPNVKRIIGIGLGKHPIEGNQFDNAYFEMEELSSEFIQMINLMAKELGYFQGYSGNGYLS